MRLHPSAILLVLVVPMLTLGAMAPGADATHVYTTVKTYVGPAATGPLNCDGALGPHVPENLGGACFNVVAGAVQRVRLTDESGLPVAATVRVLNDAGATIYTHAVCQQADVPVPSTGTHIRVAMEPPGAAQTACGTGVVAGAPTRGTITVSW